MRSRPAPNRSTSRCWRRSTGCRRLSAVVRPSALFEHGLSGRLWPIHGKPYNDEVLSSWLVRLSRAYGAEPTRFCAQVWPHRALWSQDIAQGTDHELLRVLAAKTATPRTRVLATTV
jgi:TniQ